MAKRSGGEGSAEGGEARTVALTEEFGAQLRRMGDAGEKITQLLSMVQLERASQGAAGVRWARSLRPESRLTGVV